jgi:hypothetical protein
VSRAPHLHRPVPSAQTTHPSMPRCDTSTPRAQRLVSGVAEAPGSRSREATISLKAFPRQLQPLPNRVRPRRFARFSFVLATLVVGCSSSGWSDGQADDFRQGVCVEWGGVSKNSTDCECLLDATQSAYPDAKDFRDSTGPSKLRAGYMSCGFLFSN